MIAPPHTVSPMNARLYENTPCIAAAGAGQPAEADWPFEAELSRPMHPPRTFGGGSRPAGHELDFSNGLHVEPAFPDREGLVETAYADFHSFLASIGLSASGAVSLTIRHDASLAHEAFQISVHRSGITLAAGDTEGVRRGLVHLEDAILARGRACLPLGVTRRKPTIRTRLSRCFYGPVNRPPLCRDELLDDHDYYPDGYLNRLAHHGINGLWLTIRFRDLLPSRVLPELKPDAGARKRLAKLRRIVAQCSRYGIRIYPFCIEPAALPLDSPVLRAHPALRGADTYGARALFCTSSATGQAYLEEAARTLFEAVPGLGGLLCIPVGERFTHCYSGGLAITCPRCAKRKPWEVLADTLGALARGMQASAPDAELIAWPYGQLVVWGTGATREAAGHLPPGVCLQHNFETGGRVKQLGKWRPLWDYWLSWVGPSRNFSDCARAARRNGTPMFAKLQTSCSHEVATTQYVPVPGLLYRKYRRMHALGVSGVMQGWYFGNYPALMTRATPLLAFAPFPRTETDFLHALAAPQWGRHAVRVVRAWQHFSDGYSQYPGAQRFGYYGPMHDGAVWPLYLEPRNLPLAPTWRNVHPLSGDAVAECIAPDFTFAEVLALCKSLRDHWRRGTAILKSIAADGALDDACRREINVALALGVHFDCAYNILYFYALRERLAVAVSRRQRQALLRRLAGIVRDEIANDRILLALCKTNPTLGFHSEAEGYKYYPAVIRWRIGQLQHLLRTEFPRVEQQFGQCHSETFAACTGRGGAPLAYSCQPAPPGTSPAADPFAPVWDACRVEACRHWAAPRASDAAAPFPFNSTLHPVPPRQAPRQPGISWRALCDSRAIHFCFSWTATPAGELARSVSERDVIRLTIEPERLALGLTFAIPLQQPEAGDGSLEQHRAKRGDECRLTLALPWRTIGRPATAGRQQNPIRLHVGAFFSPIIDVLCFSGRPLLNSWAPLRPILPRNLMGYRDPAAFGWLVFGRKT